MKRLDKIEARAKVLPRLHIETCTGDESGCCPSMMDANGDEFPTIGIHDDSGEADAVANMTHDVPDLVAALRAVLERHNADGRRWVGFPRADQRESYCTTCQHRAPCPDVEAITDALEGEKP